MSLPEMPPYLTWYPRKTYSRPMPSPYLKPEQAIDRVATRFPQATLGPPRLVWSPRRESTSPIRPFYQIPLDDRVVYVDMEGGILDELTPLGLGG